MSLTLYYASDVHGADVLWRKFVNAGRFYGADVLVMGGDVAGKAVAPIVATEGGYRCDLVGGEPFGEYELEAVEGRLRAAGLYPHVVTEDELAAMHADPATATRVFKRVMIDAFAAWLALADERLGGSGICLYVMLGNDDEPELREVIAASQVAVDPEDVVVDLGEGFEMISCGWSNPTPWDSPREMPEEQLESHLEKLITGVQDPGRTVFNVHVPPISTAIDTAPALDANLKPVVRGGTVVMAPAGSKAVRNIIERYQPPLALHGHIHEARGTVKLGRTVCINPGSEYGEGVLHGALAVLDRRKGLRRYQLVSG